LSTDRTYTRTYFKKIPDNTGISKIILVKGGHGFSNNCPSFVSNHFFNVKINFREDFPHFTLYSNAEGFLCMPYNCVGVFYETGSVTHKKGAGRPIVRTNP
jgi:hypothetical protein